MIPRSTCAHPCVLSCHPGSCPPCQVLLPKDSCFCGKDPADGSRVKCGDPKAIPHTCGNVCNRPLNCGLHSCENACHAQCEPCHKIIGSVSCFCGSESRNLLCGNPEPSSPFSCGKLSPVKMECGNHTFVRKCGDMDRKCPLSFQTCACGSSLSPKSRSSCSDPFEHCSVKKQIRLACGHEVMVSCRLPIHLVPVGFPSDPVECSEAVTQFCRCSRSKRTIACNIVKTDPFLCTQPCRTYKTCEKCKCDIVCCPDFSRRDFLAESHICHTVCDKLLNCGTHKCDEIHHLGRCKKCTIIIREPLSCGCGKTVLNPPFQCGTPLPACHGICNKELACGHRDLSRCHTGACAPCTILVSKECAGGHQNLHQIPCFAEKVACNLKCGKPLSCGQHRDKAGCHSGPCQPCNQPCGTKLSFCEHECQFPCGHGGPGCSVEPCRARVIAACACGLRTEEVQCRGCESSPFPSTPVLSCSSECAIAQRQAALRQAFKPEDVPDGEEAEKYSGELVSLAEKNDKFVRLLDASLVEAAETRARTLNLPPTDQTKRYLTLEYVQIHFRFEAEVIKEGDNLHVAVHFVAGETRVPRPTLSALLDMLPSQTLKYIVDFDPEGPQIHLYDVARGFGRMTVEKVNRELKPWIGSYRTRRGEGFNLYLDFFDANKAVAAFRKIQSVSGLEQSRLLNVILLDPTSPQSREEGEDNAQSLESAGEGADNTRTLESAEKGDEPASVKE